MSFTPLGQGIPLIDQIADALCARAPYQVMTYDSPASSPMPSLEALGEVMSRLRAALFPGYFGNARIAASSLRYHLSASLDSLYRQLAEQIRRGICFTRAETSSACADCCDLAQEKALDFLAQLPAIRDLLAGDVKAAYEGDPAAKTPGETIFCYPSLVAMTNHRIAHALHALDVPLIPRIISEMAHSATGIDIHPGASIGPEFFIDHGTGVVIGETSVIGARCRVYQGVTLGALSFVADGSGVLVKGMPRHPILEDEVIVYAGATILGRVTIGGNSIIGGNVWLTRDVPRNSRIVQQQSVDSIVPSGKAAGDIMTGFGAGV
ncbi:MAG: serine acetyltransferase [Desulfovibrio sp.]|jgi:serine O-acetyltransferase|nr:serine acetyltransferase [Desulfovibrio sp.]